MFAGHRRGLVRERSVLANMYLHRDKTACIVSKLPLSGALRVLKEEKAELVTGRRSLEIRGFKEEKAQLVTGKSVAQVVKSISSDSDKRELIVCKVPPSGVLRVLEEEKAELVTGRSNRVLRDFKEEAELVTGKSGVQANTYHHSDTIELIVCKLPLSGVLRVLEEEKAELVTGKQQK